METKEKPQNSVFVLFKKSYLGTALFLFNCLVFLLLINSLITLAYKIRDIVFVPKLFLPELSSKFTEDGTPVPNGKRNWYHDVFLDRRAYGQEYTDQEVGEILDEFSDFHTKHSTYAGAGIIDPPLFSGKHLKILKDFSDVRYRATPSSEKAIEKSDFTIYTLGGSNTFGNNVDDKGTWPSQLDLLLSAKFPQKKIRVVNYGRAGFDSSLELNLLLLLIQKGHKPDLVVFMDGANEFRGLGGDHFGVNDLRKMIEESYNPKPPTIVDLPLFKNMGMARLAFSVKNHILKKGDELSQITAKKGAEFDDPNKIAQTMANNYVLNKTSTIGLTEKNGIQTLFFLGPDVLFNYNLALLKKQVPDFYTEERRNYKKIFYDLTKKKTQSIELLNLFEKWGHQKAIVDDCHFSPAFAKFIAENMLPHVAQKIKAKRL